MFCELLTGLVFHLAGSSLRQDGGSQGDSLQPCILRKADTGMGPELQGTPCYSSQSMPLIQQWLHCWSRSFLSHLIPHRCDEPGGLSLPGLQRELPRCPPGLLLCEAGNWTQVSMLLMFWKRTAPTSSALRCFRRTVVASYLQVNF